MNQQFIEILQVALGTRDRMTRALSDKEWRDVHKVAERYSLIGVVFCGIERLPRSEGSGQVPDQSPGFNLLMDWVWQSEYLKKLNELMNGRCGEITEMLASDGYRSCILKGQANATYYPRPELRTSGDIDIWVVPEDSEGLDKDRKQVAEYVLAREKDYLRMQYHHIDYHVFQDVEVEVHFCPTLLFNRKKNEVLQAKFRSEMDACFGNWVSPSVTGREKTFCMLTYMPNVLMQLVHMYRHVFDGGMGLKQVVDFYYLLVDIRRRHGAEAIAGLGKDVEEIGLTDFCGGVCYVIEQLLLNGTDDGMLVVKPNRKHGEMLIKEIEKKNVKRERINKNPDSRSKMSNFVHSIVHNSRLWRYYPSDCLWNIYYRLSQYCWRRKNGWK